MSATQPPSTDASAPLVFISYSRQDAGWKAQLRRHLSLPERQGLITVWDDTDIQIGQEWASEIDRAIERASVAVLLITPSYLASETVENEVALLLKFAHPRGGLSIFPILLEPCLWEENYLLRQLQLFPKDAQPIAMHGQSTQDRLLKEAAEHIIRLAAGRDTSSRKPRAKAKLKGTPPPAAEEVVRTVSTGGRPTVTALNDLKLAEETQGVRFVASRLAQFSDEEPVRITSSSLLFAIAEIGGGLSPFHKYRAPAFLYDSLSVKDGSDYERTFASKFPRLSARQQLYDVNVAGAELLTENVPHIFRLASEISQRTYTPAPAGAPPQPSYEPEIAGEVGARHLLAALCVFKPGRGESGAMRRLRAIRPDVDALRQSFYEFIVSTWPADNAGAWRSILLPEEAAGSGAAVEVEGGKQEAAAAGEFRAPLAGFLTDNWEGEDLLGITPDVNALASLVAAWSVEPPLSIGLFGDWGSGKSHFMRQMKARVEKLSRRARQSPEPQHKLGYYKHIVQIEFNAWHYIEGNLWASLVEHIFEHLRLSDKEQVNLVAKRRQALMSKLGITKEIQARAEQRKKELEAQGEAARERAESARSATSETTRDLALLRDEFKAEVLDRFELPINFSDEQKELLSRLGIPEKSLKSAAKVHEQYLETRSLWGRVRARWDFFRRDPSYARRLAVALAVLLIPAAVGFGLPLVYQALRNERLDRFYALLASAFTFVLTFWRGARPYLHKFREWLSLIEKKEREIAAERQKRVAELEHELGVLTRQYLDAEREAETIRGQVRRLEKELAETDAGRILADFIEDRAACNDYRRHLGVLALIRRDFEKLADLFRQQRRDEQAGRARPGEHTINRIILYIDDLDRCPPERVVQVLQAIHLLLAFPLFVVVVGVDARWVTRSLQESYEWLRAEPDGAEQETPAAAGEPRAATPHDYLEKIFQIPFWLNPLDNAACQTFLDGLTKDSLQDAGPNGDARRPTPADDRAGVEAGTDPGRTSGGGKTPPTVVVPAEDAGDPAAPKAGEGGDSEAAEDGAPPNAPEGVGGEPGGRGGEGGPPAGWEEDDGEQIDLEPRSLKLTDPEVKYMKELTPLVGRSPRSVKRFLNCYRLIKVGLSPEQLARFVEGDGRGGEFRAVMILLGIITGAPSVSIYVIEELEERRRRGALGGTLHDFVESLARKPEVGGRPEWARVSGFLKGHVAPEVSGDVLKSLLRNAPRVARYSFRVAKFEAPAGRPGASASASGSAHDAA